MASDFADISSLIASSPFDKASFDGSQVDSFGTSKLNASKHREPHPDQRVSSVRSDETSAGSTNHSVSSSGAEALWDECLRGLRSELPVQAYNTWLKPLRPQFASGLTAEKTVLHLVAPNRFIQDWVKTKLFSVICAVYREKAAKFDYLAENPMLVVANHLPSSDESQIDLSASHPSQVATQETGSLPGQKGFSSEPRLEGLTNGASTSTASYISKPQGSEGSLQGYQTQVPRSTAGSIIEGKLSHRGALNRESTFENFVEGKSNQLARAAAMQVAENPGFAYNPLFIYGGVGLGKTHLMHAIGNHLLAKKPDAKIVYLHSETFVGTMVNALQLNAIDEFKRFYRSADALLIDDIQFFAGKERSQEEFFHTFNALLEGGQQIILTSDRYHKEINGLEERLKSRFGWGLTVAVEPPELETRAAILMNKAALVDVSLPNDAAMFIAQRLRSNVRELEGALKRVIAHANFKGEPISVELIKEALRDLFSLQDKLVTIDNIQRTVAEYYKIKMSDMLSKRRNRSVARPRQVAMCLSKELTNHSLPEIGDAFGGRDHTTVMHACKQIAKLRQETIDIEEDYNNLLRLLSS